MGQPSVNPPVRPRGTRLAQLGRPVRLFAGLTALTVIAGLMFVPSFWPFVTRLDHWTADWRTAYLSHRPPTQNSRLAIVAITDATLRNYTSSPIDRDLLARLVEAIDKAGASVIGLDILFLKQTDADKDERLIQAVKKARAKVVLGALDERGDLLPFQREFQFAYLARAGQPTGYLNTRHENDDVVRYTASPAPGSIYPRSFASVLAAAVGVVNADDAGKPIAWLMSAADGTPAFFSIDGEKLLDPALQKANADQITALKGRTVLIGGVFPFRDRHRVPITVRTGEMVPGVVIHATVIAGLIDPAHNIAEIAPGTVRMMLAGLALAAMALGLALWRSVPVAFLGHGFAVGLLLAADAFCFTQLRLLLPFTLAVTAWVAGLTAGRLFGAFGASDLIFGRKLS